jgi:hypothetical protein
MSATYVLGQPAQIDTIKRPAPEPFSQYVYFNWRNISRDNRGWFIRQDAAWTIKMLREDGWIAKVIDSQAQADDSIWVYIEVEGADDAMPGPAPQSPNVFPSPVAVASFAAELAPPPQRSVDRNEAIAAIRKNLKARSSTPWSVRGGEGTAWGWITITAAPRRCVNGNMTPEDCHELAQLLGLDSAHYQGVSIPASNGHRLEYLDRSAGRVPEVYGEIYWD